MVSTQKTFFPTNPAFPSILSKAHLLPQNCVPAVLDRSSVNRSSTKILQSPSIVKVISKQAEIHSRTLFNGLAFNGSTPKSVSDLIDLGANRNDDAITDEHVDETAAFENDVAYYKVLLEARERHREALRSKLRVLRTVRAKRPSMQRRRVTTRHRPSKATATTCLSDSNSKSGINQQQLVASGTWPTPCASPVSTDIESDASSVLDDDTVSVGKPVIYAA